MHSSGSVMDRVLGADLELPSALLPLTRSGDVPMTEEAATAAAPLAAPWLGRWLLAMLLFGLLGGLGLWAGSWLLGPQHMTLTRVRVDGQVRHTSRETLRRTLAKCAKGSFFALDLTSIRKTLEALPWVAQASVRRVWPLTLVVRLREREALAHWGDKDLVSPSGEVFTPDSASMPPGLILLQGPTGTAREMVERYRWIQAHLAAHGLEPVRLELSARRAWYLDLKGGMHLSLGTQDLEERLERFLDYLPRLPQLQQIEQVDLRYTNGFAVRWREQATATRQEAWRTAHPRSRVATHR
jgi:cell division protein FtsQ